MDSDDVKKVIGIVLVIITSIILLIEIGVAIFAKIQLNREVVSYWNLSDKSSSIVKKTEYLDKFVLALEKQNFEGQYDAINAFKTPDNSFDDNFAALKSLQTRMHDIQKMDVTSFEYQTAMQQITGQEQGEADAMISIFKGLWWKNNHYLLWNAPGVIQIVFVIIILIVGIVLWSNNSY